MDEVILQNKQQVDSLNEEIDALKEQNHLFHDEIESLIETAEMKGEADTGGSDSGKIDNDGSDSADNALNYPVNGEADDGDLEGASQDENIPDDEDYDAEDQRQVDPNTGEIIESPIDGGDEIHDVNSEEEGLPEDESEDYNQGDNNLYGDDHDKEEPIEEDPVESETIIDNDQSNDENYQTSDEMNDEINSEEEYQVVGYEPESSKFLSPSKSS